jgi:cell fate regulator YaaT (PSP1 superfamily)
MPDVVGVRFKQCGKIYSFEVNGVSVKHGMWVVVESGMGLSLGLVVKARHNIEQSEQQFKKVIRIATVQDMEADRNNRSLKDEARAFCTERARSHNLLMKVVGTEATLDRKRLIFYFTAEGRIDFRELVRDLASKFKTRIEMRQIGVRDEVKFVGGIGCCGREVCCKVFLTSFEPISIRMAKKQELVLNPGKLSGICGRLMCCLGYEIEQPTKEIINEKVVSIETEDKAMILAEESVEEAVETYKEKTQPPQPLNAPKETKSEEGQVKTHISKKVPKKDRGKPFNKRKKFWKKKKRQ